MSKPKYKDFYQWHAQNKPHGGNLEDAIICRDAWDAAVEGTWAIADDEIPQSKIGKFIVKIIKKLEARDE